jgi:hypothetical protein
MQAIKMDLIFCHGKALIVVIIGPPLYPMKMSGLQEMVIILERFKHHQKVAIAIFNAFVNKKTKNESLF